MKVLNYQQRKVCDAVPKLIALKNFVTELLLIENYMENYMESFAQYNPNIILVLIF